jgi:23S rRNA (uracil1939-C5)-methyltransferase
VASEVTITALSHAGEGIAHEGERTVFVPYALPGERVVIERIATEGKRVRAKLMAVRERSPDRVEPPCPYHFRPADSLSRACGGCQLQHLRYAAQLTFKETLVREQLRRVAGLSDPVVHAIVPAPAELEYRNHVQWSLTDQGALGLRAANSHHVVRIERCLLAEPPITAISQRIVLEDPPPSEADAAAEATEAPVPAHALLARVGVRSGDTALIVFEPIDEVPAIALDLPVAAAAVRPDGSSFAIADDDALTITVKGQPFRVSASSFFQVNTAQAATLVELVLAAANLTGRETVLDLYCGVGLFSAFLAPQAARLIGVEVFEPAIHDAAANLDPHEHVALYAASAESVLPTLDVAIDVAVVDPPRAGLSERALAALARARPARLVYVSCDPATLARDIARFAQHGHRLAEVTPIDLFPQTHHIECVAVLLRE